MRPPLHVIASFSLGCVLWFFTKSIYAGGLLCLTGIFVDLDHVLEYAMHHGWYKFSIKNLFEACRQTEARQGELKFDKLYLVFHSIEITLLLWALAIYTGNIYMLAIALGHTSHMILDAIANPFYFHSYFIISRIMKKFDIEKFFKVRNGKN